MAFQKARSGDRFLIQQGISVVPKSYIPANYIAAWNTGRTVPTVGDLVKQDVSSSTVLGSDCVRQCVTNDVPYGMVWSVNSNTTLASTTGSATLSILKFNKIVSIELEVADMSTITMGHSVLVDGTAAGVGAGTVKINGQLRDRVIDSGLAFNASTSGTANVTSNAAGRIVSLSAVTGVGLVVVEYPF